MERAASLWVARHALGALSPEDDRAFEIWCDEDIANRPCFDRMRGVLAQTDGAEQELRSAHEVANAREAVTRRRRGVVASICVVLVSVGLWAGWPADLHTGRGQVAEYRLADGSRLWLDANSAVDVEIDGTARRLRLRQGRIHVAVKHEGRPFSVTAAGRDVIDVGTEFDVALEQDGASTQVTNGRVNVVGNTSQTSLEAGQGLRWDENGRARPTSADEGGDALAWRRGELVFHRRSLREVVAVLDRYSRKRLWLSNRVAADRLVSGVVRANDVEHGLASIAQSQGLRVEDWGLVVILR